MKPKCYGCNAVANARGKCNYHYGVERRAEKVHAQRKKHRMHPNSLANLVNTPKHPGANIPGFAEFLSEKATNNRDEVMRKLQEEARKDPVRFPGGCVPWSMIPADPRPQQEIVRLGRIPGSTGFRRV